MRKYIQAQVILLTLGGTILTGCGGGGGSNSAGSVPAPNVYITEENALQKAKEGYQVTTLVNIPLLSTLSTNGSAQQSHRMTLDDVAILALKHIKRQEATSPSDRVTAQGTSSETEECEYGGTVTYTEVDQDDNPETLQVGDSFTAIFESCKVDEFTEMNGKMVVTFTKVGEISDTAFNVDARIVAQNLSFKTDSDNTVLNGTLDGGFNTTETTDDRALKSDKFQIENSSVKAVIYALDYATHYDLASGAWWFTRDNVQDVNGEVIRVDTTARFDGQGCNYPYQGSGIIYGKSSSVKVTARSGNITDLEIDTDGDGTIDVTKQVGSNEVFDLLCY